MLGAARSMSETARLLESARAGDRQALDSVYARHQGRLLHFIRASMSGLAHRVSPEDILQETLLESARKIDAFEPRGPASFYRWLVGIARFKLAEAARSQRAKKRSSEEPLDRTPAANETSPSGRAIRGEQVGHLRDALASLPQRQADAVRLRYLEALSLAESASRLGCSEAAVKALVSRGLMELARRIHEES